ncbi:SDR family oxidoreductase [Luteococcus sediminum]
MTSLPVALVTGGSRGIGLAVCHRLASTHHLLVGGRSPETTRQVASQLPSAEPFCCDLDDTEAVEQAMSRVQRLDVLVLSAGITAGGTVAETPLDEWRRVMQTNLFSVVGLTRLALPLLRESRGMVVTINSGSGFTSKPGNGVYSASKFALRAFTDALREEERGTVRVSSVHPGRVDTDMQREMWAELGRDYAPDDHLRPQSVAEAVALAVLASPEANLDEISIRPVVQS